MNESISCPTCRRRLPLRAELIGRTVRCPICAVAFVAEMPTAAISVITPIVPAAPVATPAELPWPYGSAPPARGSARPPSPQPRSSPVPLFESPGDNFPRGPQPPGREPYDIFEDSADESIEFAAPMPSFSPSPKPVPSTAPAPSQNAADARGHPFFTALFTDWSPRERFWLKVAVTLVLSGALAVTLPILGLRLRKLAETTPQQYTLVGVILLKLGFGIAGLTWQAHLLRRSRPGRWTAVVIVAAIVLYLVLRLYGINVFGR